MCLGFGLLVAQNKTFKDITVLVSALVAVHAAWTHGCNCRRFDSSQQPWLHVIPLSHRFLCVLHLSLYNEGKIAPKISLKKL